MADLTLGELVAVGEMLAVPLHEAMTGLEQPRAIACIVCVMQRRADPGYTLDQALGLHMRDVELVGADPEAPAGNNGGEPALLPASGT